MVIRLLTVLGWVVAHTPEPILEGLSWALGEAGYLALRRRRRLLHSNLHHAFPDRPAGWYCRMARICSRRVVETGLLSLATPHLSENRIRGMASVAPSAAEVFRDHARNPRPLVLGTLHLALWETQTWIRLLIPGEPRAIGVIYRPLDHAAADAYVRSTRERFGLRLLSRHDGFNEARQILRENGTVGILFDQNAGARGCLTLFLGRVCSTSELPGLLMSHFGAELRTFTPRRTAFWRVRFESDPVPNDGTAAGATLALNRWLENTLSQDEVQCGNWLWAHDRWRHQDVPVKRFRLESKRNLLPADLAGRGLTDLPRRTRIWIRLPNWLGDVVMAAPLLRALRESRPDAEITVLARTGFQSLVAGWTFVDRFVALPPRGAGYFLAMAKLRAGYPDLWVAFTNSIRGDLEGLATGAPQRFGVLRPGRPRPLLTHAFRSGPPDPHRHQLADWEDFFRHFGLETPLSRAALSPRPAARASTDPLGLIPGSENNPEKRWPVVHWRELISALPNEQFLLFGTAGDQPITAQIAAGMPSDRVTDLAGRTDLSQYIDRLRSCRAVVCNDTGGMHLANALGVPVLALFGPTNPLRTGPVFAAPRRIVQPPGCPPAGGALLTRLGPECVLTELSALGKTADLA